MKLKFTFTWCNSSDQEQTVVLFLMRAGRFNYFSLTRKTFALLDDKGNNAGTSLQILCEPSFHVLRSSALSHPAF